MSPTVKREEDVMKGFQFCWVDGGGINIEAMDTERMHEYPEPSSSVVRVFEDDSIHFPKIFRNTWDGDFRSGKPRIGLFLAIKKIGIGWHKVVKNDKGFPIKQK